MKKTIVSVLLLAVVAIVGVSAQSSDPACEKKCCNTSCNKKEASNKTTQVDNKSCVPVCDKTASAKNVSKTKPADESLAKLK